MQFPSSLIGKSNSCKYTRNKKILKICDFKNVEDTLGLSERTE